MVITPWDAFLVGDRVVYTGTYSPERVGSFGTVVKHKKYTDTPNHPANINVLWDDGEQFMGVFPENITHLNRKAEWEL